MRKAVEMDELLSCKNRLYLTVRRGEKGGCGRVLITMGTCLLTYLASLMLQHSLTGYLLMETQSRFISGLCARYGSDSEFWIKECKGELGSHADPDWRYPSRNLSQIDVGDG